LKKLKLYLETTIFNFYFADDAPDKKADTIKLFMEIAENKYEAFTAMSVIKEISRASDEKQQLMFDLINKNNISILVHHFLNEYANFKALYHPSCISNGRLLAVH
jgi:hypothetical protein